jgi:hypothetical protein
MPELEYLSDFKVLLSDKENDFSDKQMNEKDLFFSSQSFKISESKLYSEITAEEIISHKVIKQRGFFTNETWTTTHLLSARIIKLSKDSVQCECIVSKQDKIIQVRQFPKDLFSHIYPLKEGCFVKLKISYKPGSVRTDIIDGKGLDIESDFEPFDIWDQLKEFDNKHF